MPWRGPEYEGEFPTLGYQVADLIQASCVIPDGDWMGRPFMLTDEQLRCLLYHYRIDPETGKFVYFRGTQFTRPQKYGKGPFSAALICAEAHPEGPVLFDGWDAAGEPVGRPWATPHVQVTAVSEDQPLALDTPVPTPDGWSTVGALEVGDRVLDSTGRACVVERSTPVLVGEDCYAVTFSDGERVVASGEHGWTVERKRRRGDCHERVTLTTRELAESVCDSKGGKRCRVPLVPFDLPAVALEVDPYLLGLWLGDGATNDATVALDHRLRDEYEAILSPLLEWFEVPVWGRGPGNQATVRIRKREYLCAWGHDWSDDRVAQSGGHEHCATCRREYRLGKDRTGTRLYTLRERLRRIGVLGNKRIPDVYLRAGNEQRLALLQGLIDSDGHVTSKGRVSFTNTNERLARDVGRLLTMLGYGWTIRFDGTAWRVFFTAADERPVARLGYKVAAQRQGLAGSRRRSTSRWRYVESVEPVPSVPVRCIGIGTDDHLFLVGERAVPTHNTDNVFRALLPMVQLGPLADVFTDVGLTRINLPTGGVIEPVTASAVSRLGQRITLSLQDQTESWVASNGGHKLADNQRRGLAGMGGRWFSTPNAWDPVEDSVAQRTGESKAPGVYLDDADPGPGSIRNKKERRRMLKKVYGDSATKPRKDAEWEPWVDLDRIDGEIEALVEYDPAQAERWFLNRKLASEGAAFDIQRFESLAEPKLVEDGAIVVMGVDGARYQDAIAVVGCEVKTGYIWQVAVVERPAHLQRDADYEHDFSIVDGAVREVFERFNVWRMYCDPHRIDVLLEPLKNQYGRKVVVDWLTNRPRPIAWAVRNLQSAITSGDLRHDGSPELVRHFANSRKRKLTVLDDNERPMHTLSKPSHMSPEKIDLAMAAVLAWEARGDCIAEGGVSFNAVEPDREPVRPLAWSPGEALPAHLLVGRPEVGPLGGMS